MLLIKTVVLLCSATAAMAVRSLVSGAIFVGKDTTDPSASLSQIYIDPRNHATAAASVLVFAADSVKFYPTSQEPKALSQNLDQFMTKVTTFPGFMKNDAQFYLELDGSLDSLEDAIMNQFVDSDTVLALLDLVPDNVQDQSLTDWVLSLIIVSKPDGTDTIDIRLVQLYLMISSDGNRVTIPKQSARLFVSDLQVIESVFVSNAETFADRIPITSIPGFIAFFTSPKSFSRGDHVQRGSTSCFKSRQTFKNRQAILSQIL